MDAYDVAVERMSKEPIDQVRRRWNQALRRDVDRTNRSLEPLGLLLFGKCAKERGGEPVSFWNIGCLTQVKCHYKDAETKELTTAIRADERLPNDGDDITHEMLPVFAEWQRRMDVMLDREPPAMPASESGVQL